MLWNCKTCTHLHKTHNCNYAIVHRYVILLHSKYERIQYQNRKDLLLFLSWICFHSNKSVKVQIWRQYKKRKPPFKKTNFVITTLIVCYRFPSLFAMVAFSKYPTSNKTTDNKGAQNLGNKKASANSQNFKYQARG